MLLFIEDFRDWRLALVVAISFEFKNLILIFFEKKNLNRSCNDYCWFDFVVDVSVCE